MQWELSGRFSLKVTAVNTQEARIFKKREGSKKSIQVTTLPTQAEIPRPSTTTVDHK